MVSILCGLKMVTLKLVVLLHDLHLYLRRGWEKSDWVLLFFPLFSFISNWQNTMQSHVIFNQYIVDTNPLKLGYIEIWGVGSAPVSNVSVSLSSTVITPAFTYNPTTQVCDQWKVQMVFPNPEIPSAIPACFPSRWYPLLQSPSGSPLCSLGQQWTAWGWRESSWVIIIWNWVSGSLFSMYIFLSANLHRTCLYSFTSASEIYFQNSLNYHMSSNIRYHQLKLLRYFMCHEERKKD